MGLVVAARPVDQAGPFGPLFVDATEREDGGLHAVINQFLAATGNFYNQAMQPRLLNNLHCSLGEY